MKIVVTGADGQIGSELRKVASSYNSYSFQFLNREGLDITDSTAVNQLFKNLQPDILINCAAYTAVDKAEVEKDSATLVNVDAPSILAKACKEHDCFMIHYSSDYVYHIGGNQPLLESDNNNPKGIYASTKLEGERKVLNTLKKSIVIRTSWVYSSFGNNFVKTMIRLGKERDKLNIVSDQIGTPTYAHDIAIATLDIIKQIANPEFDDFGIYNFSNAGITNWADFAKKIFELENITCEVYPITTKEFGAPADRPLWSVLSKEKIQKIFGLNIPNWEKSLQKCLLELKKGKH